MLTTLHIR